MVLTGLMIGDYACTRCTWRSTDASRPLSRGINVGCPACSADARFVGGHTGPSMYTLDDIRQLTREYADEHHNEARLATQLFGRRFTEWIEKREKEQAKC